MADQWTVEFYADEHGREPCRQWMEKLGRVGPQLRRVHPAILQQHIGHTRIDRLRVTHVASAFDAIDEANDAIDEACTSADPARAASAKYRRIVGPAAADPRDSPVGDHHLHEAAALQARLGVREVLRARR